MTAQPATGIVATVPPATPNAGAALRAVAVIAQRDLVRQLRHPGVLGSQALQMVFFVLVYAVGFDGLVQRVGDVPFSAFVFPGIIAIQVVGLAVGSGMNYAMDREFGVLREMQIAPVPRFCLPAGKAAATVVLATAQSAFLLCFCPVLGIPAGFGEALAALLVYALTAAAFSSIGLLLATTVRRIETLQAVVQLAMYPLLFLSGSVFPPGSAPDWLATAIVFNPMTYAVDLVREVLGVQVGPPATAGPVMDVAVLLVALLAGAVAIRAKVGR